MGQKQDIDEILRKFSVQVSELDALKGFNPDDVRHGLQILLDEIGKLEEKINLTSGPNAPTRIPLDLEQLAKDYISLRNKVQKNETTVAEILKLVKKTNSEVNKPDPQKTTICDWCGEVCTSVFIGGPYNNSQFCSTGCMKSWTTDWEKNNQY